MRAIHILMIVFLISLNTFAQSQQYSKSDIEDYISKIKSEQLILDNPMLLINDIFVLEYKDLKQTHEFSGTLDYVEKGNVDMIEKYGEIAENGIIKINLKNQQKNNLSDENVLFMVNNKLVEKESLYNYEPDMIQSMNVYKNRKEILKHTFEECDGLVVIKLKD